MVAKIIHSKSIRAIISYNENKVRDSEAKLLLAAGFPVGHEQLSFNGKLERFLKLTRQNERTQTNAMHVILSFSPQDKLDNDILQSIALQYMEAIGFVSQPFLLYRHYDTYNPHIHLATVNIAPGGQRIETHNIGRNQSEGARKLLEELYGLVKAEEQHKEDDFFLRPVSLQKVVHGKSAAKAEVTTIVRQITDTYKFTSLPELNAVLHQFNLMAYRGPEGSRMYENGGLVYCILDEHGEPASQPIKASSIFGSPTLKNLQKKFAPNETERKPYGERLKHLVDKALSGKPTLAELEQRLRKKGIRILLRLSATNEVYGATFIDNGTRCVFNGGDLGKAYAANSFMERLAGIGITQTLLSTALPGTTIGEEGKNIESPLKEKGIYSGGGQPAIQIMQGNRTTEILEGVGTGPYKRKVRKIGLE